MLDIWSEKYTPKDINEIKVNLPQNLKKKLINMKPGAIPHMIFSGPVGCGKLIFSKFIAERRLEDPAETLKIVTGETKITKEEKDALKKSSNIKSSRIGSSAGSSVTWPSFLHARARDFIMTKPIFSPYKILIIREFHKIKNQESFRRIMERFGHCRIILTSSNPSTILDPIVSRCIWIQFKKININDFKTALQEVAKGEGLTLQDGEIKFLYSVLNGNIGAATNIIQTTYLTEEELSRATLKKALSQDKKLSVIPILQAAFDKSLALLKKNLDFALASQDPITLYRRLNSELAQQEIDDLPELLMYMAKHEMDLIDCFDQRIQLTNILINL